MEELEQEGEKERGTEGRREDRSYEDFMRRGRTE